MRTRKVFGVFIATLMLIGAVPFEVAAAQEDDGPQAEHHADEVFWLAEETDSRFVTRSGEELGEDDEFVLELTADLSGGNELGSDTLEPGVGDPDGTGDATISLRETGSVCWEIAVTNIMLPTMAAHIHEGAADVNGPVVVPLGGPDTTGVSAGCAAADVGLVDAIASNPAGYYINVHTTDFPDGAVRAQLEGGFGANPGDQIFLTEDLFASDAAGVKGDRIGHTVIQCTFGIAQTTQCDGTAFLDGRGQLHLTATVPFTEEPAPFDIAVVGGTGDFAAFGGDATLTDQETDEGPSTTLYAVRLKDLAR